MDKVIEWVLKSAGMAVSVGILMVALLLALSFFLNPQGFTFAGLKFGPNLSASLPDGAIIAVRGPCPEPAWTQPDDLTGRFLISANPSGAHRRPAFQFDTVVGSHTTTLSVPNLPPHVHRGETLTGLEVGRWAVPNKVGGSVLPNVVTGYDPNHINPAYPTGGKAPGMEHFHRFETKESVDMDAAPFNVIPESFVVSFCELTEETP